MGHSVSLQWNASSDPVDGYQIFHGTAAGQEGATPINAALVTGTTYVDTVAAQPGPNFYSVRSSIGGVLSNPIEVSTVLLPAPPTNLIVTAAV